jgi:hypothetical protein
MSGRLREYAPPWRRESHSASRQEPVSERLCGTLGPLCQAAKARAKRALAEKD